MKEIKPLLFWALLLVLNSSCAGKKSTPKDALVYNEKLVRLIANVDSARGKIGDKIDESHQESLHELQKYRTVVDTALKNIKTITYSNDSLFKINVMQYLIMNKFYAEKTFPYLIDLKKKQIEGMTSTMDEISAQYLIEGINKQIDSVSRCIEKAQGKFALINKIQLQ